MFILGWEGGWLRWDFRIGTCFFLKVITFRVPCLLNSVSRDSLVINDRKQTQISLSINKVLLKKKHLKSLQSQGGDKPQSHRILRRGMIDLGYENHKFLFLPTDIIL